ncbi:Tetratricopeptide TPR_1 repeat-containing protein [Halothece sp. PCC 7418]|uniref:tetratricopeptide repeat protein n=1 Tax=Halothece sp. (strain PCC 7418) TaxID=65093 RepID=UPI0002A065AB|nr:tetratricopeptide repeat protein [Halothece sp. PCC 7418]AFZ45417.1 Tetratricopeptide TPR_1 repeat-containing protein [Halothece sp. PCC 7418]
MTSTIDPQALHKQAETYINQQRLQEAFTLCEQMIKEHPDFAPAYQTLGKVFHLTEQVEKAEQCYLKAIALDSNSAVAHTNLGSLYGQQKQFKKALSCYQKALTLEPKEPKIYQNLARLWGKSGDSNRATEAWFRAYSLDVHKISAQKHIELGDALLKQNAIEKAIACYRRSFHLDSNNKEALQKLKQALKRVGQEIATSRSSFIIFAYPRTGSSTLVKLLNLHPDLNCRPEPFHQDYGVSLQAQYLSNTQKDPSLELDPERSRNSQHWVTQYPLPVLDRIIAEINEQNHNGIKHLSYSLSFDQNLHLLMNVYDRIIFLKRKNQLKRIISLYISLQAGFFQGDRNQLFKKQYQPLDIEKLKRHLNWEKTRQEQYRTIVQALGLDLLELNYEDFLDPKLTPADKIDKLNEVYRYLGVSEIKSGSTMEKMQKLLNPNQNKFNDEQTYRLIPNIDEIAATLGSEETGYLFD